MILLFLVPELPAQEQRLLTFRHLQMGTTFNVVVQCRDTVAAARAVQATFAYLDSLNSTLSDYLPESELSTLPGRAYEQSQVVSKELFEVLKRAQQISRVSEGAFDVTVGPLSQVWRRAFRTEQFPDPARIEEAKSRVNFQAVRLNQDSLTVRMLLPRMQLDVGGIAKGYAAEQMVARLTEAGFPHVLVDAGGDLVLGFPPEGKPGWRVLPLWPDDQLEPIYLSNTAVATSGDTYRFLEWEGTRYSHIIDPRTGLGVSRERLVTVQTNSGSLADALASLISILGGDGFPMAEELSGDDPLQIWLWEKTPKGWILLEFSNL